MNTAIQVAQFGPATADGEAPGGGFGFFLPFLAMMLILYALMIRPQQKERKRVQQLQDGLSKGDWVVAGAGMHGRVTAIADDIVTVEIADRVRVKFNRSAVTAKLESGEAKEKPDQKREKSA